MYMHFQEGTTVYATSPTMLVAGMVLRDVMGGGQFQITPHGSKTRKENTDSRQFEIVE